MQQLFVGPETARVLRAEPLGAHVDGFVEALVSTGYEPATLNEKVLVLAQFGRWLERRGLSARDLDDGRAGEFLHWRRRRYRAHRGAKATLAQFLNYLREERALTRATLVNYLPLVDRFLVDRFADGPVLVDQLKASDVTRFVLRRAHAMSPGRAKLLVTALRSFLRFLFLRGETETDLSPSVPTVADWRLAKLPKFIAGEEVQRLLGACNGESATGRRGPRLHDFRHRLAVKTLIGWYRQGVDVERRLPVLSTYLGHGHITDTYWYLTAVPELLRLAAERIEGRREIQP